MQNLKVLSILFVAFFCSIEGYRNNNGRFQAGSSYGNREAFRPQQEALPNKQSGSVISVIVIDDQSDSATSGQLNNGYGASQQPTDFDDQADFSGGSSDFFGDGAANLKSGSYSSNGQSSLSRLRGSSYNQRQAKGKNGYGQQSGSISDSKNGYGSDNQFGQLNNDGVVQSSFIVIDKEFGERIRSLIDSIRSNRAATSQPGSSDAGRLVNQSPWRAVPRSPANLNRGYQTSESGSLSQGYKAATGIKGSSSSQKGKVSLPGGY